MSDEQDLIRQLERIRAAVHRRKRQMPEHSMERKAYLLAAHLIGQALRNLCLAVYLEEDAHRRPEP